MVGGAVVVVVGGAVVVVVGGAVVVVVGGAVVVVVGGAVVVVVGGAVVVVVVGGVAGAQPVLVMTLSSSVTLPLRASARPWTVAPVCTEIDVRARIVPMNAVPVPSVAELPTCQNTLHALAPLISTTLLFEAVISVDPAWNRNTESDWPCPSRVRVPVSPRVTLP